ncbi:PAP2 superfamily protein [Lachnospiraceae bacterium XBB2008]|nr:PAP2 superfamily protein [Lachnospiraceae bacterium XBB2008]
MSFDIQYLLLLQDLRNATGGIFNEIFNGISKFAVDILPFLPFVILWCVDKNWGYRFITAIMGGEVVNGIIKLTVCAYRPWIRSDLIEPAGDSKTAATGYSFPSGHTMCATTMYGSVFVWQKDKRRWLAVVCAVMIALTAFSRNFLGVHTPQDVLVSFVESSLLIFIIGLVGKRIAGNDKLIDILSIIGIFAIIGVLIYIIFKPYPMDYVDGELLVDPQKMMNDCFKGCGGFLGLVIGSYIERHFIHYEIPFGSRHLGLMTAVGIGLMMAWSQWFGNATIVAAFGAHWGRLIAMFIQVMFAIVVWPIAIRKTCSEE